MDNIYDDLENYDEVNIVEELKKENAELKLKLEDYAKVMDKLQKDFNKVTTEFKNLEVNYSSLLKTARAEIERKTNIINTLNIEKDMMVLNSIQNGNRRILNLRKNLPQKICAEDTKNSHPSKKSITVDDRKTRKIESESNVENRLPSEEIVTSPPNSDVNNYKNSKTNSGHKEFDENAGKYLAKQKYEKGFRSNTIRNRRNSMEVVSSTKFSADDGSENDSSDDKTKRRSPIRDQIHNNIGHEKRHSDRNRPMTSEKTLSTHGNYDERKSIYYKNRGNMYVEDYRKRGKFEPNSRHRRRISTDRYSSRRGDRDHYDDYDRGHRPEHNNERISPPFDGRRKSREPRSNYQKDYSQHSENKRESYQERHTTKHKIPADRNEPPNKRFKTTLHCNPYNEVLERSHFVSCESPDDSAVDNVAPETPIKEIMNTAAMHLEDPRVTSDKYILATDTDKVVISTVIGRNLELKTIDKATWGYPSLPELLQRPRENTEFFLKNVYMDIDNRPTLNLSLESGEVLDSEINDDVNNVNVSNDVNNIQEEPLDVISNVESFRNCAEYQKLNVTGTNLDESKSCCITNPKFTNFLEIPTNEGAQNCVEKTFYEKQINDEQPQEFLKHSEQQKITLSEEMVQEDLELTDEDEDSDRISSKIKEKKKDRKHRDKKPNKSKNWTKETETDNHEYIGTHNDQKNDLKDNKISSENVKTKFSDLFGDSNSLITPEDLQLHSNQLRVQNTVGLLPNFEEELHENKSLKDIPSSIDNVHNKSMSIIREENDITNNDTKQNSDYEDNISCNQTMTDTDRQLDTPTEKLNEVNSILNETSFIKSTSEIKLCSMDNDNEQSIIKSVIISTGFQTQCGSTQRDPLETYTDSNETENITTKKCALKVQESLITALATSTPHKEIRQDAMSNVESKSNSDSNVNDSIITSGSHSTVVDELSNAKINGSQNNADEPDIRVFARRRRRIVKKSV